MGLGNSSFQKDEVITGQKTHTILPLFIIIFIILFSLAKWKFNFAIMLEAEQTLSAEN